MARIDVAWTQNNQILIPDVRIRKDDPSYVYVPLRGYSASLAVFNCNDRCIGWIDVTDLGYPDVKAWMGGVNWRDGGY